MKRLIAVLMISILILSGCGEPSKPTGINADFAREEEIREQIEEASKKTAEDYKQFEERMNEIDAESEILDEFAAGYDSSDITIDDVDATDFFITYFYPFAGKYTSWNPVSDFIDENPEFVIINNYGSLIVLENQEGEKITYSFDSNDKSKPLRSLSYHQPETDAEIVFYPQRNVYTYRIVGQNTVDLAGFGQALIMLFDPKEVN